MHWTAPVGKREEITESRCILSGQVELTPSVVYGYCSSSQCVSESHFLNRLRWFAVGINDTIFLRIVKVNDEWFILSLYGVTSCRRRALRRTGFQRQLERDRRWKY